MTTCFECEPSRTGTSTLKPPTAALCAKCGKPCVSGHFVDPEDQPARTAEQERADVVAYLRRNANAAEDLAWRPLLKKLIEGIADLIERGRHVSKP